MDSWTVKEEKLAFLNSLKTPENEGLINELKLAVSSPFDYALCNEAEYQLKSCEMPVTAESVTLFHDLLADKLSFEDIDAEYDEAVFWAADRFLEKAEGKSL